jgi:AraC-like DNA-binding protein
MKQLRSPTFPDPLADSLDTIRFRSVMFCLSRLGAPWGFSVDARGFASFHLITSGKALLEVEGIGRSWISSGDLVILPHGHAHALRDQVSSPVTKLDRLLEAAYDSQEGKLAAGGPGPVTTVLCGGFQHEGLAAHKLTAALPPVIHLKGDAYDDRIWIGLALKLLREEAASFRPGADAVIRRLAELLFVEAMRSYVVSRDSVRRQFVADVRDPRIGRAIRAMQRAPGARWSLLGLAREAAMSRTAFACRFREIMGVPPGSFVTRMRMTRAADLLRTSRLTLKAIAAESGYRSDAAFSRSFKRFFGESPARYRNHQHVPASQERGALPLRRVEQSAN